MTQTTILIIDDSATIRRLVDQELSQGGYRVVTAASAEEGLRRAEEIRPELILLDHQLPGTTGLEVCRRLLESDELREIPVVVSSTLRKKAYAEYTDLPNVVDLLPKPYAGDLLKTTVANALDTGAMIVASQMQGTAVPEVIRELQDATLAGQFNVFGLREVLDFLNNGSKRGVLEVDGEPGRVWFFLDEGRIQGVTATGVEPNVVAASLPTSLDDLAPVLNFTVGGRVCCEVDGLVELLDRKVLDPRLLRKLLRHQAAVLTRMSFTRKLTGFRFQNEVPLPPLVRKLKLDVSLVALLVNEALHCDEAGLPLEADGTAYVRGNLHGQNLDRAGFSAAHMKVLGLLAEPMSSKELAMRLGCDQAEARRVLHGFVLAELAQTTQQLQSRTVIGIEHDPAAAQQIRQVLSDQSRRYTGHVVRDHVALRLLLRRCQPDAVLIAVNNENCGAMLAEVQTSVDASGHNPKWLAIGDPNGSTNGHPKFDGRIPRPYQAETLVKTLDGVFQSVHRESCDTAAGVAIWPNGETRQLQTMTES